jgi:hypothetical protein
MAIYGVGSKWQEVELKDRFFNEGKFILGWNENSAKDLYAFVAALKVGDILYIKASAPGSRSIRIKGIGVVKRNLIGCINSGEFTNTPITSWESLFIRVEWLHRDEFEIVIPDNEGKLTNMRAATAYEEYLPYVQEKIIEKIVNNIGVR